MSRCTQIAAIALLTLASAGQAAPKKVEQPLFMPLPPISISVSPPVEAPPSDMTTSVPYSYDPKSANIEGMGSLEFRFDTSRFITNVGAASYGEEPLELSFAKDGRPVACISQNTENPSKIAQEGCAQLMAGAFFRYDHAFALPFERGILRIIVISQRTALPAIPIRFGDAKHGIPVSIELVQTGKRRRCTIGFGDFPESSYALICKAFMVTPSARTRRFSSGAPMRGRSVLIAAWVVPRAGSPWLEVDWTDAYPETASYPVYPDDGIAENQMLRSADGRVTATISDDDYPISALRSELQGATRVLLGFDGQGQAVSCQPIGSSGYALLDNATCQLASTRVRYMFAPGKGGYEGVRFVRTHVRWIIPED